VRQQIIDLTTNRCDRTLSEDSRQNARKKTLKIRDFNPTAVVAVMGADRARKGWHEEAFGLRSWLRRPASPLGRLALFIVYFWFGVLKVFGVSPAGPLVTALWLKTISFIPLEKFMLLFACYEMLIGILFLIPRLERLATASLLVHVCTTCMPLVLLPHIVWQMFMVPSLEGQYIIKNIVVVALALSIRGRRKRRPAAQPVSAIPGNPPRVIRLRDGRMAQLSWPFAD
jgi:uncharacterized membrane protein YkgB